MKPARAAQLRDQVQTLRQQQTPMAEQIRQLQQERDEATNQLAGLLAESAQLKSNAIQNKRETLKLRERDYPIAGNCNRKQRMIHLLNR